MKGGLAAMVMAVAMFVATSTTAKGACEFQAAGTQLAEDFVQFPAGYLPVSVDSWAISDTVVYVEVEGNGPTGYEYRTVAMGTGPGLPVLGRGPITQDPLFDVFPGKSVVVGSFWVGKKNGNLRVVDMTDPSNPAPIATLDLPGNISSMIEEGSIVYVTSGGSLYSISLANPFAPTVLDSLANAGGLAYGLGKVRSGLLPLGTGSTQTALVDVNNPGILSVVSTVSHAASTLGSRAIAGTRLVVANDFDASLEIWDAFDPANPIALPGIELLAPYSDAVLGGSASGFVYYGVTSDQGKVFAVDLSDPGNPVQADVDSLTEGGGFDTRLVGSTLIVVGFGEVSRFQLNGCSTLPRVLSGPFSQAADAGGNDITLSTTTDLAVDYQWKKDGQPISDGAYVIGANTDTLTLSATPANAGIYTLEVSNLDGSNESQQAIVAIRQVEPTGACTLSGGECLEATQAECAATDGAYSGDGSECVIVPPTITNITQDTVHPTLADAIANSAKGDVIEIGAGRLIEWGLLLHDEDITIRGQGRDATIIDGNYMGRVFKSQAGDDSTFEDLTIRRGIPVDVTGAGGFEIAVDCHLTFRRVDFRECDGMGNAYAAVRSTGTGTTAIVFDSCKFLDNFGAITASAFQGLGSVVFLNCLFAGNNGATHTVYPQGQAALYNCTFVNNPENFGVSGTTTVTNCVFDGSHTVKTIAGAATASDSLYPGATGTNIDGAPTFVDATNGDYRLAAGSLGIDAADYDAYASAGGGATDLNGGSRAMNDFSVTDTGFGAKSFLDMGAYEFQLPTVAADVDSDGDVDLSDYALFFQCIGGPNTPPADGCPF